MTVPYLSVNIIIVLPRQEIRECWPSRNETELSNFIQHQKQRNHRGHRNHNRPNSVWPDKWWELESAHQKTSYDKVKIYTFNIIYHLWRVFYQDKIIAIKTTDIKFWNEYLSQGFIINFQWFHKYYMKNGYWRNNNTSNSFFHLVSKILLQLIR